MVLVTLTPTLPLPLPLTRYTLLLMGLKVAYQLPIVCGSPPLSLRASVDDGSGTGGVVAYCEEGIGGGDLGAAALPSRSDYKLGLHKYYGPLVTKAIVRRPTIPTATLTILTMAILLKVLRPLLAAAGRGHLRTPAALEPYPYPPTPTPRDKGIFPAALLTLALTLVLTLALTLALPLPLPLSLTLPLPLTRSACCPTCCCCCCSSSTARCCTCAVACALALVPARHRPRL